MRSLENNNKFTSTQLVKFLICAMLGVGLLQLPSILTEHTGNEAFYIPIFAGIICLGSAYLICKAGSMYNGRGLVGSAKYTYGKTIGVIIIIPLLLIYLIACAVEARVFTQTIKLFLLDTTPTWAILIPFYFLILFLLRGELRHIIRFIEFVLPFILIIVSILFILVIPGSDFTDLLPIGQRTFLEYYRAIDGSIFSFLGIISLLVIYPNIKKKDLKSNFKVTALAVGIISVIYMITVALCISKLGTAETKWLLYPTISLIKSAYIPGGFIERLEGILMSIWVILVFATIAIALYAMTTIILDIFNFKDRRFITTCIIPFIYIASSSALSILEVMNVSIVSGYILGPYSMFILPLLIIIGYRVKQKRRGSSHEN